MRNVLSVSNNFLQKKLTSQHRYYLELVILCLLYSASGIIGLRINAVATFATLIWLPSGIALTTMLLFGYKVWPAIAIGAVIVNITTGASIPISLCIALGNTSEIIIATYLLKTLQFQYAMQRLRDVLLLILLAAPLGSIVAASIGTTSLLLGNKIPVALFSATWQAWFVGDMMSMILITPFLLTWIIKNYAHLPSVRRSVEVIIFLIITSIVCFFIFTGTLNHIIGHGSTIYLVFPLLIWAALRFSQRAAITTVLIISIAAATATVFHTGPFATGITSGDLLFLQVFLQVVALTAMCLAAVNTERKQYEERKDEFISLASHELKTPLTSLKILTHLAQRTITPTSKKLADYLEKMDREIDRITSLTSSLLDVSRIQAGTLQMQKEIFDCIPFLEDIIETMQPTTLHPIRFKYNKADKKLKIFADKARFSQVLINFLTNAMKYSSKHKRIVVSVVAQKRQIVIKVKDNGIGISPEDQTRIFQRYFRANEDGQTTYPGLGLGLYIAKQIVLQHHGKMWVKSEKGHGATFFVSLPLVMEARHLNFFSKKNSSR